MNRFVSGLTSALLFTLSSSGNAGLQGPPDTTTKRSESNPPFPAAVKFDLYRSYLIVVPCSSSGQEHLSFVADTGADPTVLDRRAARKLGLRAFDKGQVADVGGIARGESAILPELRLGPIRATNLKVLVSDLSFLEKALHVRIDGMIGIDVLGKVPFMIDYKARLISFSEAPSLDRSVRYQVVGHFPTVEITLNGGRFRLMVDTGASSLMLFERRVEGQVAQHEGGSIKRSANLSGSFQRTQVSLGHAILGDADLGTQTGFVVANQKDVGTDFDGLLSPVALGISQMAVDPRHGVIHFNRSVKANFIVDEALRSPGGNRLAVESDGESYAVFGATPSQETALREQIRLMHPEVLPLRVFFVPHWKYIDSERIFQLHVPKGYMSLMFTHLLSRTVFIDNDRYMGENWLGHWIAHELGHLVTSSAKEEDAERAAREFRKRLRDSQRQDLH